jgi:hypothetical protein
MELEEKRSFAAHNINDGWFILSPPDSEINTAFAEMLGFFETRESFVDLLPYCNVGGLIQDVSNTLQISEKY